MVLLLLVACAPQMPAKTTEAQPQTAPTQETAPATAPATEPAPSQPAVVPSQPAVSNEMDADTTQRLNTNFGPGVKLAVSHPTGLQMKIGDRKVLGVAFRSMARAADDFQLNYTLYRAYDKSANSLLVGDNDIKNWLTASLLDGKHYAYAPVTLNPGDTRRYNFVFDVKPTYADGTATKPGTYEFQFTVYNKDGNYQIFNEYDKVKMSIQVLG
jgi:hypothetical protein